jgi:hypothetical protein
VTISVLVISASLTTFGSIYFYVNFSQKNVIKKLDTDISKSVSDLKGTKDAGKILTIQNQLNSLTLLHTSKPVASRLYKFLATVVPGPTNPKDLPPVTLSRVSTSFADSTLEFTGTAKTFDYVNKFVDTLKFAQFSTSLVTDKLPTGEDCEKNNLPPGFHKDEKGFCVKDTKKAFSTVVLSSFGYNEKGISYKITLKFDSGLFSGTVDSVELTIPQIITTRSITELPSIIQADPAPIKKN